MSKPFRTAELLSRIQANLRKKGRESALKVWKSGDLEAGQVALNGTELAVSAAEYRLLLLLMRNAGRIVKRETLAGHLWEDAGEGIGDNTLTVTVSRLRRKVGTRYIETIWGFGYRFTESVREQTVLEMGYTEQGMDYLYEGSRLSRISDLVMAVENILAAAGVFLVYLEKQRKSPLPNHTVFLPDVSC